MGSCFGEEMHERMKALGMDSNANPFGVIFHPHALKNNCALIENAASRALFESYIQPADFFEYQGIFHSLQHANKFQHPQSNALYEAVFEAAHQAYNQLKQAQFIGITLGTAWIYWHKPSQQPVGNCHKLPQQDFEKSLSKQIDVQAQILGIINHLRHINPTALLVFTVSPVRHLRDGVSENLLSKSTLISALHEVLSAERIQTMKHMHYFPAYDIIREELNDWNYYRDDKMHPSEEAIDIVFKRFYNAFFATNDSTFSAEL